MRPKGEKAATDVVVESTAEKAAKIEAIEAQHDVPHPTMEGMVRILARWLSQSSSWDMGITDEMQALHNMMLVKLSVPFVVQDKNKANAPRQLKINKAVQTAAARAAKVATARALKALESVKVAA